MGMFDTVYCSYPLPGHPPKDVASYDFQTKDFDSLMDTYHITEEGELRLEGVHCSGITRKVTIGWSNVVAIAAGLYTRDGADAHYLDYELKIVDGMVVDAKEITNRKQSALPSDKLDLFGLSWNDVQPTRELGPLAPGQLLFVLWGGSDLESGYEVKVLASNDRQIVVETEKGFEILHKGNYGATLFHSREQAAEEREAHKRANVERRKRYERELKEHVASQQPDAEK